MKVWIIYDGRANVMDTDDCAVYEAFSEPEESLEDVKAAIKDRWNDGVIFEYDTEMRKGVKGRGDVNFLVNQRRVWDKELEEWQRKQLEGIHMPANKLRITHIAHSLQEGWVVLLINKEKYEYTVDGAALFRFLEQLNRPNSNKGRTLAYLKRAAKSYRKL